MTYLRLESINPTENRRRYYVVTGPLRTLWGTFGVLCQWGRKDQAPRGLRILEASDEAAARLELARVVALRRRHGYRMKQPPG